MIEKYDNTKIFSELTFAVIGAVIEVHKFMGRGLLESIYHQCLKEELRIRGINFITEMKIPVIYKTKEMEIDFRCDLFIENCLFVELKSVKEITTAYEAELLTCMKLLKALKGILINLNFQNIFKEGQRTYVNEYFSSLPKI